MKIGYKIIIVSLSLGALVYPSKMAYSRYEAFTTLRATETNALLKSFKTRPDSFYTNSAYELGVKSYMEKNIQNIKIDLNAPDVPLKVPVVETTESAISVTESSITSAGLDAEKAVVTEEVLKESLNETPKEKPIVKETPKKTVETKLPEKKEPEKKVVIAGTPVQDKKVDNLQYYAQLGVFKSLENANNLIQKVGGGFVVVKSTVNDKQYIVRSNPGSREDIEALSERVKRKESSLTPIIRVW